MNIAFVEIQNFRKLKACRVEIGAETTIFVGANNSGKTSAMDALILFLKQSRRKAFATTDFTLSHWASLDHVGAKWVDAGDEEEPELSLDALFPLLPSLDVWIKADEDDLHRIVHLLPTLDWTPQELLGVRLVFAPKSVEQLYKDFRIARKRALEAVSASSNAGSPPYIWPRSMRDFLERKLHSQFEVRSYILDPARCESPVQGRAKPQLLPVDSAPLKHEPFDGLLKIDLISAQRGFSDPKSEDMSHAGYGSLSTQLRRYYEKHLNPSEAPDVRDIEVLEAIGEASRVFDEKLNESFKPAIGELEGLNYPGFADPRISITSKIDPGESLDHGTAVQFDFPGADSLSLPERYNGLGYQNLISMVFSLIRFRDEWMRVGKAAKNLESVNASIEPLHLVLVEEPEAHLHAQVQQVFIRKAYEVLRRGTALVDSSLRTQMIVSTHSSHIAHELDFSCLRYFRREPVTKVGEIPTATVINLSQTFGGEDETSRFASRYIKTTHCDLFFADAAILVEGSAERMLMPHFVRAKFPKLDQSYISLLEIGGAHAHRLKPLLETLGLLSLVVTDLDSIHQSTATKARPERGKGYRTGNATLKNWVPQREALDDLLDLPESDKATTDGNIGVAYQCPIRVVYRQGEGEQEAIPYTFEDSLALANMELFRGYERPIGLLQKLKAALEKDSLEDASDAMFKSLEKGSKAELALELLYLSEPNQVEPPSYIADGLKWLERKLDGKRVDAIVKEVDEVNDA